jgi:APA family basic amino acid/polyamine antiporter
MPTVASPHPAEGSAHSRPEAALGVTFGVLLTVGSAAAIGILRSPSAIASQMPSFWGYLAVWLLGGAYGLLVALTLARLARYNRSSGGPYVFVREAFGEIPGFLIGWIDWVALCGVLAVVASVLGDYAIGILPELRAPEAIALLVIAVLTLVQWLGLRPAAWTHNASALTKIVALLVFVAVCFYFGTRDVASMTFEPEREGSILTAFLIAFNAVLITVHGSAAPVYFAADFRDADRTLPKAVATGVCAVVALYLLVNVAILKVVPLATIAGKHVAADVVSDRLFGPDGALVARLLIVLALISGVSATALVAPRILKAMGETGALWRTMSEPSRGGTPEMALLVTAGVAAVLVATGADEWVMHCVAAVFAITSALSFLAAMKRPEERGAHRTGSVIGVIASVVILAGVVLHDPTSLLRIGVVAVVGLVVYAIARVTRSNPAGV